MVENLAWSFSRKLRSQISRSAHRWRFARPWSPGWRSRPTALNATQQAQLASQAQPVLPQVPTWPECSNRQNQNSERCNNGSERIIDACNSSINIHLYITSFIDTLKIYEILQLKQRNMAKRILPGPPRTWTRWGILDDTNRGILRKSEGYAKANNSNPNKIMEFPPKAVQPLTKT